MFRRYGSGSGRPGRGLAVLFFVLAVVALTRCAAAGAGAQTGAAACHYTRAQIFERASPAVVFIATKTIDPYQTEDRVQRDVGSGFIFDPKGLILTNAHVVFGAQSIVVTLDDGKSVHARIVGIDPIFDIAILRIRANKNTPYPTIPLGVSGKLHVGDDVLAIGNPLGLDQTMTRGIVSALNRVLPETPLSLSRGMIQTDAPINPGNSGGPLLDHCGRAIGINSEILEDAQNIGFAVPIDLVKKSLPMLLKKGHLVRPWLGFYGQLIGKDLADIIRMPLVPGLLVEAIEPDSPAEKADIQSGDLDVTVDGRQYLLGGDIVTSINGIKLDSDDALARAMEGLKVGSRVTLRIFRDGKMMTVKYILPERPLQPGDIPD